MKKRIFCLILIFAAIIAFQTRLAQTEEIQQPAYKSIASSELNEKLTKDASLFILDVRTEAEYNSEHIAGVKKLIPLDQIETRIGELENLKDKEIVVYCRSGRRSAAAAQTLSTKGFTKVYNLTGGIIDYKEKGYKTEKILKPAE